MLDSDIWNGEYDISSILRGDHEVKQLQNGCSPDDVSQMLFNPIHLHGDAAEPVLDKKYLVDGENSRPSWPDNAEFAVCLTHDVDHVHIDHLPHFIREKKNRILDSFDRMEEKTHLSQWLKIYALFKNVMTFLPDVIDYTSNYEGSQIDRFQDILDIEQSVNATSTFFAMPDYVGTRHKSDHLYRYDDTLEFNRVQMTVGELFAQIQSQGWEIGLHPTVVAHDDHTEMLKQKNSLDAVLDEPCVSVRSHRLCGDIRKTPSVLSHAGFDYDSTFGLKGRNGFRYGTSYPYNLYDWKNNNWSSVLEIPHVIQDSYLGMNWHQWDGSCLDTDVRFQYIKMYAERVRQVGGVLTLNFHTRPFESDIWKSFYKRVLSYLDDKNAYIGSMQKIGSHWEKSDISRQMNKYPSCSVDCW